jgi:hypothetical protein
MTTTLKRFVAVRNKLESEQFALISRLRQIETLLSRIRNIVEVDLDPEPVKRRKVRDQTAVL